jgi:membrane protease YdiL (CAAX protease family)
MSKQSTEQKQHQVFRDIPFDGTFSTAMSTVFVQCVFFHQVIWFCPLMAPHIWKQIFNPPVWWGLVDEAAASILGYSLVIVLLCQSGFLNSWADQPMKLARFYFRQPTSSAWTGLTMVLEGLFVGALTLGIAISVGKPGGWQLFLFRDGLYRCGLTPFMEECFYRGFIYMILWSGTQNSIEDYPWLKRAWMNEVIPLALSAIIFAAAHPISIAFVQLVHEIPADHARGLAFTWDAAQIHGLRFVRALLFTGAFRLSRSLYTAVLVHSVYNLVTVVRILAR